MFGKLFNTPVDFSGQAERMSAGTPTYRADRAAMIHGYEGHRMAFDDQNNAASSHRYAAHMTSDPMIKAYHTAKAGFHSQMASYHETAMKDALKK